MLLLDLRHPGLNRVTTCRERELTLHYIHTFLNTQGHRWPSRMRDQLNAGASPRKHIHESRYTPFTYSFILTRRIWKDDCDGQMIFGDLVRLKLPDICLTDEENPPKKPHSVILSRSGIEPGPAAWKTLMLPPTTEADLNGYTIFFIIIALYS